MLYSARLRRLMEEERKAPQATDIRVAQEVSQGDRQAPAHRRRGRAAARQPHPQRRQEARPEARRGQPPFRRLLRQALSRLRAVVPRSDQRGEHRPDRGRQALTTPARRSSSSPTRCGGSASRSSTRSRISAASFRLPQKQANLLYRIGKAQANLRYDLQRDPSSEEIAKKLEVDVEDVNAPAAGLRRERLALLRHRRGARVPPLATSSSRRRSPRPTSSSLTARCASTSRGALAELDEKEEKRRRPAVRPGRGRVPNAQGDRRDDGPVARAHPPDRGAGARKAQPLPEDARCSAAT